MSEAIPTWFNTVERRSLLLAAAKAWERTPFFANSEAQGRDGGVDCVHLENAIYSSLGVMERLEIPRQIMDLGQHSDKSPLIEAFETIPQLKERFRRVPFEPVCSSPNTFNRVLEVLLPGDFLCFDAGKIPHHGGIMLPGGEFLHVLNPEGAYRMQLKARVRGWCILAQLARAYRPLP